MKRIVEGAPVAEWVEQQVGEPFSSPYVAMGVEQDGEMLGGVIFNCFTGQNVDVTVAGSPKAWTPIFFRRLAHYVWRELGCCRVSIITQQENVPDLVERMGGKPEGIAENWFGEGRPGHRYVILREDWKFKT